MKFYRYMNAVEYNMLMNGEYIKDLHTWEDCFTDSEGVCFLPCESAQEALEADDFLAGVVGNFALVEFVNVGREPIFSQGFYSCGFVRECYLPDGYNFTDMRPVRVAFPDKWGGFFTSSFVRFKGKKGAKEWDMP